MRLVWAGGRVIDCKVGFMLALECIVSEKKGRKNWRSGLDIEVQMLTVLPYSLEKQ